MAQKVRVELVDDLDGSVIEGSKGETVEFALDGTTFEIDLGERNAKKLRDALAPYVNAGRKTGAKRGRPRGGGAKRDPEQTKAIKTWGAANGFKVPERGRLSNELLEAYEAAHKEG